MTTTTIDNDNSDTAPFDMTQWGILNDFAGGKFGFESATEFVVFGAGQKYVFTGSDFTYDSNGNPTGGTISHLRMVDTGDGLNIMQMGKFSLTVDQLENFALTNDVSGFENAVLGSDHNWFNVGFHKETLHVVGSDGDDTFNFKSGEDISTADTFDGGGGNNTAIFGGTGDGNSAFLLQAGMLENIQDIKFEGTTSYDVILQDPNISGGKTLTIDAHALVATIPISMLAFYETVNMNFIGGAGNDTYYGSAGDDQITGGLGADMLSGFTGHNTFIYHSAAESTGLSLDSISDFVASKDHFQMPHAVNAIDAAVTTGALDFNTNFDTELQAAMNGHLHAHDAILFTPDSGNLAGFTFLVVDQNGHAGYQSGHDIVIQVSGANTDLTGFSTANFLT